MPHKQTPPISNVQSVEFYVLGSEDAEKDSSVKVTDSSFFSKGVPVDSGLYDRRLGTDRSTWKCLTCYQNKKGCPGHSGHAKSNYPLQNPLFAKEILKWLKVICHSCGKFVIKSDFINLKSFPIDKILSEFTKKVRSGNDKYRQCINCGEEHPWVISDDEYGTLLFSEYYQKGIKNQPYKTQPLYNHQIQKIFNKITDEQCLLMGIPLVSHPKKLILDNFVISSTVIRPEISRIGGNRSTMADTTNSLKTIIELNNSIPREIPDEIDKKLQNILILIDLAFLEMIKGTNVNSTGLKLMTNTNKMSMSLSQRLPTKGGRFRGNLTGKRTTKMGRSVITGDPSLNLNEVGLPEMLCRGISIPTTVRPWNKHFLTKCFENGIEHYPGCVKITRIIDGDDYYIDKLPKNYTLQDGDIVHRHAVDGDQVCFNRQPSLWWCSITALKIRVVEGLTLRINPILCVLFNADFDGDESNIIFLDDIEAQIEASLLSSPYQWFISYQNSLPMMGLFQDSIIGASEMTKNDINIHPFWAMKMINKCVNYDNDIVLDKKSVNSRDLISNFIPDVSFSKKAKFYKPEFEKYIKYKDNEINVVIKNGVLIQGVLDKSTIGQNADGGLFHTIYGQFGAAISLNCMFNLQQIFDAFLLFKGFTFGFGDIIPNVDVEKQIKIEIDKNIQNSLDFSEKYNNGDIIPPVGISKEEFYEDQQMEILSHGDELIEPVIKNIDFENNNLFKAILCGSKGNLPNLLSIHGAKGSIGVGGSRIKEELLDRTSIYYPRFDDNPKSKGYDTSNFSKGIDPETFFFSSLETRHDLIEISLGTAVGGTMNRNGTKNLEDIIISHKYGAVKKRRMVQPLCGETGIDPRKMKSVKFPTIMISDKEFKDNYHTKISSLHKRYQNKNVQKILDDEFKTLSEDRKHYRDIFLRIESENFKKILSNKVRLPVDIVRIIKNTKSLTNDKDFKKEGVDPIQAIELMGKVNETLESTFQNGEIPDHITKSITLLMISLRSYLSTSNLIKRGITLDMLNVILKQVSNNLKSAFMAPGSMYGVIAAQCISQPVTQYFLDAKHRSGLKKAKTSIATRFEEIIKNKPTEEMDNPQMYLTPRDEYKYNEDTVKTIASHIEMLNLNNFIIEDECFIEVLGGDTKYPEDKQMVKQFIDDTRIMAPIPTNLTKWCIRYTLDTDKLIIKDMNLRTIYLKLVDKFPDIYVVYNPVIGDKNSIFKIYFRNTFFKKDQVSNEYTIKDISNKIRQVTLRGVDGIISTSVVDMIHSNVIDDGSISMDKYYIIETNGTNMSKIMENEYLNPYKCYSTSIRENEQIFGIGAARNKIVSELKSIIDDSSNIEYITVYADEMSYKYKITSIQRAGLGKREQNKVLQRASFGSPIQVLQNAAINGQIDAVDSSISSEMIMGTCPKFGTNYSEISINHKQVAEMTKSSLDILDNL